MQWRSCDLFASPLVCMIRSWCWLVYVWKLWVQVTISCYCCSCKKRFIILSTRTLPWPQPSVNFPLCCPYLLSSLPSGGLLKEDDICIRFLLALRRFCYWGTLSQDLDYHTPNGVPSLIRPTTILGSCNSRPQCSSGSADFKSFERLVSNCDGRNGLSKKVGS